MRQKKSEYHETIIYYKYLLAHQLNKCWLRYRLIKNEIPSFILLLLYYSVLFSKLIELYFY